MPLVMVPDGRFGMLTAVRETAKVGGVRAWVFRCDCGAEATKRIYDVLSGRTKSCGCASVALTAAAKVKHGANRRGGRRSPEYTTWLLLRDRCNNPRNPKYARYGGRGITVCGRWNDFATFLADMGPKPSTGHSIDRIDNDGPYSPENCRWASRDEQRNNKSASVRVVVNGERLTRKEAMARLGISFAKARQLPTVRLYAEVSR